MSEKPKPFYWIPGINLLVLVIYTVLSKIFDGKEGWGAVTMCIFVHVVICIIAWIACLASSSDRKLAPRWLLSFLLVLVIGFSTCTTIFDIRI